MNRALMTTRLLDFETQAFSLSHSLLSRSSSISDLNPRVVLLLQKAAPACHHIRAPLARALEGGQETILHEICDLITQTQTRIQYQYKNMMPFGGGWWSRLPVIPPPPSTMHSRVKVLVVVVGVLFGCCAVVYRYRARIRRVTGRTATRWWGLQAGERFLGRVRRRTRRGGTTMPENVFRPRNEAAATAARQPRLTTSPTKTKIPNLSTYCSTLPPGTRTSPPPAATRNRPYPNIKGSSSIPSTPPIRPGGNTPLYRMRFCK